MNKKRITAVVLLMLSIVSINVSAQQYKEFKPHIILVQPYISTENEIPEFINNELDLIRDLIEHWKENGYKNELGRICFQYSIPTIKMEEVKVMGKGYRNFEWFFLQFMAYISDIDLHSKEYHDNWLISKDALVSDLVEILEFYEKTPLDCALILQCYNIYAMTFNLLDMIESAPYDSDFESFLQEKQLDRYDIESHQEDYPNIPFARVLKMEKSVASLMETIHGILRCDYKEELENKK